MHSCVLMCAQPYRRHEGVVAFSPPLGGHDGHRCKLACHHRGGVMLVTKTLWAPPLFLVPASVFSEQLLAKFRTKQNIIPSRFIVIVFSENAVWGRLGGWISWASVFGSGHDLRVLWLSPCSAGSWLLPFPLPYPLNLHSCSLALSHTLSNK